MNGANRFMSGLAYSVGRIKPIDALAAVESVSVDLLDTLKSRGLKHFCEDSRTIPEMCLASAQRTLEETNLTAAQIQTISCSTMPRTITQQLWRLLLIPALFQPGIQVPRIAGLQPHGKNNSRIPELSDSVALQQKFSDSRQKTSSLWPTAETCQKGASLKTPKRGKSGKRVVNLRPNAPKLEEGKAVSY
jgi:hypothetical protein